MLHARVAHWQTVDGAAFDRAFEQLGGAATRPHIESSRALLRRVGAHGFPTVALERRGQLIALDIASYIGRV